jgi:hypothetical protein
LEGNDAQESKLKLDVYASMMALLERTIFQDSRQEGDVLSDGGFPLRSSFEGLATTGDELGGGILEILGAFDLISNAQESGFSVLKLCNLTNGIVK